MPPFAVGDKVKLNKSLEQAIFVDMWIGEQNANHDFKIVYGQIYRVFHIQQIKSDRWRMKFTENYFDSLWVITENFRLAPTAGIVIDMDF